MERSIESVGEQIPLLIEVDEIWRFDQKGIAKLFNQLTQGSFQVFWIAAQKFLGCQVSETPIGLCGRHMGRVRCNPIESEFSNLCLVNRYT